MWLEPLLAPEARSSRSSTAQLYPLRAARRATPRPVIPPPMITRSRTFTVARTDPRSGPGARGPSRDHGPEAAQWTSLATFLPPLAIFFTALRGAWGFKV